jgi:glycosyltransferase involved in cell wall biosynthesis
MFLEAVQLLIETKRNMRTQFLVVGDGELRSAVERLTRKMDLEERVTFTGWVKDLPPLYADLDILALTSDNEGTPVAVIEALASGVGVVATDVGGVRELIGGCGIQNAPLEVGSFEIGQHGVLVKSGDARGFAKGLQYLLDHPGLCKEMGQRGKGHTMAHHSQERLLADMDQLYRSVLQAS